MKVYDMFEKPIDRQITGVIKVGQQTEKDKKQELEEYVVTRELAKHFRNFFENYTRSIDTPTDEMGVWISGFFGSGKSHFLKILSYILGNIEVDGRNVIDYFKEKEILNSDPMILADMEKAAHTPTKAILFNVDAKSTASAKSDSNAIVMVFNRVFNEKLGYDGANPALADLERALDEEGNYQKFQESYLQVTGHTWMEERHKFRVKRSQVAKALSAMGRMTEQEAMDWTKAASTSSYNLAIEDFAERVGQYIDKTGDRVVFLVDEIGQFISSDSRLMLNLQTMTEELGTRCHGKAWIVVTAQEDIDSMMENMDASTESRNDFSKIQGRFGTRLSLTSVNADEVIRERILKKTSFGRSTLMVMYDREETRIRNAVTFKGNGYEMPKYHSAEEFAEVYPFLPYQFHLLADVLNAIRLNSASGKHLSEGERSMLGAFQEAAKNVKDMQAGVLIPFYRFYDDLLKFLDHTHASVIQRAEDSERINPLHEEDCFTVNVLKTLFLLKYIDGIPMTVDNITNFMVTDIHEDKTVLRQKVEESLRVLTSSLLVSQIQDTYEFLTDEEQDINRAIRDRNIQPADVTKALGGMVFNSIYDNTRYRVPRFNGRYTFAYNQFLDNQPMKGIQNNPITLRIITPHFTGSGEIIGLDDDSLRMLSSHQEVVLRLPQDSQIYYREIQNALKIEDYIRNVADPQKGKSTVIRTTKTQEAGRSKDAALAALKEAVGNADVFINGNYVTDIGTHDAAAKINESLGRLIDSVYYELAYIKESKDDSDIRKLFKSYEDARLDLGEEYNKDPNANAINEVQSYIQTSTSSHNMISMKSVIDYFQNTPFGYIDSDTRWILAKLFRDGDIAATVDKVPFTKFNTPADDLVTYFTVRKYEEKILFRGKVVIEPRKLKAAKDVMKALFGHTEVSTDPDKIMTSFKKDLRTLLEDVQAMLQTQKYTPQFPGKSTLEDAVRTLSGASSITDPGAFFDWVAKDKGKLMELSEELTPVRTFYRSENMQTIFRDNGLKAINLYENSKEHITDPEVGRLIRQIAEIVNSKMPYDRIKDLPDLYRRFTDAYSRILDEKLEPVQKIIDADHQTVINALKGQPFEEEFLSKVNADFIDLDDRAGSQSDISDLLGFKDKADSRMKNWLDRIGRKVAQIQAEAEEAEHRGDLSVQDGAETGVSHAAEKGANDHTGTAHKPKHLLISDITSTTWVIKDKATLNQYLDQIRDRVEKELSEGTDLYIHF